MKSNVSRRTFVKAVSATGLALLAKLSGLVPEVQILGLGEPSSSGVASAANRYYGVAGWFCCGPAWGRCGAAGGGSCGNCTNNSWSCAFPRLIRPGYPYCNYTACNYPMQDTVCEQILSVVDPCNLNSVGVKVRDCGPNMARFCGNRAPDCSPPWYYDRIIDLNQQSFSVLANLDQGLCSVYVDI